MRAPRRVLDTIIFLARSGGRLVTKEDLLAGPWKGTAVSDAALSRGIMLARRALGDGGTVIATVRGKGFRFAVEVEELFDGAKPAHGAVTESATPPLFGRAHEVRRLGDAFARARNGRGTVVIVSGDPGIGKTSLLEAFANDLRGAGARLAWGRCWEATGVPPLWPWIEIVRSCLGDCGFVRELDLPAAIQPGARNRTYCPPP